MLSRKTTFIIGAGTGCDLDFPLGSTLKDLIADLHTPTTTQDSQRFKPAARDLWDLTKASNQSLTSQALTEASFVLSNGIRFISSIHNFLELRRGEPAIYELAKATIADLILAAERHSGLRKRSNFDEIEVNSERTKNSWLPELAQILFEKVEKDNATNSLSNAQFIVFNYDRTVEFFPSQALMAIYQTPKSCALQTVAQKIIHPYGYLGPIDPTLGANALAFAGTPSFSDKIAMARRIQTYSEVVHSETRDKIRAVIAETELLVFLGFGYHPQNMELLFDRSLSSKVTQVIGTAKVMSPADRTIVASAIRRGCSGSTSYIRDIQPILEDASCTQLLRNYKRFIVG